MNESTPRSEQKAKSKHKRLAIFSSNNPDSSFSTGEVLATTGYLPGSPTRSRNDEEKLKSKNGSTIESKHKKPKRVPHSEPSQYSLNHAIHSRGSNSEPDAVDQSSSQMDGSIGTPIMTPSEVASPRSNVGETKEVLIQTGAGGSPYLDVGMQQSRLSINQSMTDMMEKFKGLPMLGETKNPREHAELFLSKLHLCKILFDFDKCDENPTAFGSQQRHSNPTSAAEVLYGKELKRKTLLELVEYVNSERGQKIFGVDNMMEEIIDMVSTNIFRTLPPQEDEYDPEEDDPVLETAWPHLQVVYEFLLRFVMSKEVPSKIAKRKGVIDQKFCLRLIHMFDSEDPRERDYLKTILHRVYGKFMSHRQFIRTQIGYTFQRFVYETERHNGISELLEILGSIINGFVLPLKEEHQVFLRTSLIPLHKPKMVSLYYQQLNYCIVQYTEKDRSTCVSIINGLYRYWPWNHSSKQVMFLNGLEEILDTVVPDFVEEMKPALLRILSKSIQSEHFQVVERTLYLWNNNHIVTHCFAKDQAKAVLPAIFGPLKQKLKQHWNPTVMNLSDEVAHLYRVVDANLWQELESSYEARTKLKEQNRKHRDYLWQRLQAGDSPSELDFEGNRTESKTQTKDANINASDFTELSKPVEAMDTS
mmetsp:Transcript_9490/g.10931  ORF Transcript_9490/g.10931 Transcript_9490/m.10931 type:complete len:646 (+) Transcript_9490:571-2508(+)